MLIHCICVICKSPFFRKHWVVEQGRDKYCSKPCEVAGRKPRHTPEEYFWMYVDTDTTPEECWPWIGSRTKRNYGRLWIKDHHVSAHIFAYELAHGLLLPGFHVCHTCDNPPCCRAEHLFAGTQAINMMDMRAKGRDSHGKEHGRIMEARNLKGERHSQAKLTEVQVLHMRSLQGKMTHRQIANLYGIATQTVSDILKRRRWAHLL